MTKEDLIKEFDRLIEAHYNKEIDSRDEWLREIIDLKDNVVNFLTIPVVSQQRELLLDFLSNVNGNLIAHPHLQMNTDFVDEYLESH